MCYAAGLFVREAARLGGRSGKFTEQKSTSVANEKETMPGCMFFWGGGAPRDHLAEI